MDHIAHHYTMGCRLGPMGSPQLTRIRQLCYKRTSRTHRTTNPTREGNRSTNTTRLGQGIIYRNFGITTVPRLRISNSMVTSSIHSTRVTQQAITRGMGASTGVDDELATQVVVPPTSLAHHPSQHKHLVVLAVREEILRSQLENNSRRKKSLRRSTRS